MALFTVINNANIHPIKMKGSIKENELFIPSFTKYIFKEVISYSVFSKLCASICINFMHFKLYVEAT